MRTGKRDGGNGWLRVVVCKVVAVGLTNARRVAKEFVL